MIKPVRSAMGSNGSDGAVSIDSVADILERELPTLIDEWLARVEKEPDLTRIPLNFEERTGHLPHLLHDVIKRLRLDAGIGMDKGKVSYQPWIVYGNLRYTW